MIDATDKALVNALQEGFPLCERPFAKAAGLLGITEEDLIGRLQKLLDQGILSRFGPMFHTGQWGGGLSLAAMAVPGERIDEVADLVNSYVEVAHNYERTHELNMWFVLATENQQRITEVLDEIRERTGLEVFDMPKHEEFFIGLRFDI